MKKGLYIHIPFCLKKCDYCDFYSIAFSKTRVEQYARALANQIKGLDSSQFDTIYFGGGTPSLLSETAFETIFRAIHQNHDVDKCAEITLEANPNSLTEKKIETLKRLGVNRVSIGVQSTNDKVLASLSRRHTGEQALKTIDQLVAAGIQNVSADLMLGTIGQTFETLEKSISDLMKSRVTHISAYILKVMENTRYYDTPNLDIPNDNMQSELYLRAVELIKSNGFAHYEISNFCKPGFESRHNLKYWDLKPYFGAGCFAASCILDKRFLNQLSVDEFCEYFDTVKPSDDEILLFEGEVDQSDYIMLSLRTTKGLSIENLKQRYNKSFSESQLDFIKSCKDLEIAEFDGEKLNLTPKGFLLSNSVIEKLI